MTQLASGVLLAWSLLACRPTAVEDWYIGGGTGEPHARWGVRSLGPNQTAITIGYGKPELGCVIAWRFLPQTCTPENLTADGQSWGGM